MKRCLHLKIYGWLEETKEISLLEKEDFYSHLNMEDISDTDHKHTYKRVCEGKYEYYC